MYIYICIYIYVYIYMYVYMKKTYKCLLNEKKKLSIVVINSRFIFSNALHVCRNVLFLRWYLNRLKMELMKVVVTTTGRLKRVTVTIYLLLLDEMPTNIAHTKTGIKHKSKVSIIILVVFEAL